MIQRIDHINIVVSDLEKAQDFFKLLGFISGPKAELSGKWISEIVGLENVKAEYLALSHPDSSVSIELISYYSPHSLPSPDADKAHKIGFRHLAFAVNDIESIVGRLRHEGVDFISEVKTYPATGKKLVYFKGPDNILLEFAEYPGK